MRSFPLLCFTGNTEENGKLFARQTRVLISERGRDMLQVLSALPVLAAFGTAAGLAAAVVLGLLGLAFFAELIAGLFFRTLRFFTWLPALLGVLGLALCLLAPLPVTASAVLIFWGIYGVLILCGWGLSSLLRSVWFFLRR